MVCGLFAALSKIYPVYQSYPKTVEKILEFYTVAVPRVIFFNISIGEANSTADTIIGFMQVYCQYNVERWNALDDDKQNNQGYDDLVLLMQIVKDALFQLAISSYDEEDESNITVIQRMGHLCRNQRSETLIMFPYFRFKYICTTLHSFSCIRSRCS